jgi:GNAT superfamily N-acetyltransferase
MTPRDTSAPSDASAGAEPLIRAYRADDAASLRDCIAELQDAERAIDGRLRPGRAIASDYLDAMLEACRRYAGQVFVLDVAGTVAGFTTVFAHVPFERLDEPPGDYALVAELLVRHPYRRRGYARALLVCGERYAAPGRVGSTYRCPERQHRRAYAVRRLRLQAVPGDPFEIARAATP